MAQADNNRIAKNSLMLSIRMLFTMWLNLYATRIVLQQLGTEDYGVYGVVGSIVSMLTILNSGLIKTIQRFITYELGKKDGNVNNTFCSLLNVTIIFGFVSVVILEILGVWFLEDYMKVPEESKAAAFWVLQFSIATTFVTLLSNPYNALIIAYEKMGVFAYISIIQVLLNFFAAFLLKYIPGNHLFWYGFFIMVSSITIRIIYQIYCKIKLSQFKYHLYFNKQQIIEILKFAGWASLDGGLSTIVWNGVIWIFNFCFGPAINAVYSISNQVNNSILGFAQNVQKAIDPQITKSYASGDFERHRKLVYSGSKIQAFIIFLIIIPFIIRCDYILHLWLGNVPNYAVEFCQMAVFMGLAVSFVEVARTSVVATGRIRRFVVIPNSLHLLLLPLCIVLNRLYDSPIVMMGAIIITYYIIYGIRLYIAAHGSVFSAKVMLLKTIMPCAIAGVVSFCILFFCSKVISNDLIGLLFFLSLSFVVIVLCTYCICLSHQEKNIIKNILIIKLKKSR